MANYILFLLKWPRAIGICYTSVAVHQWGTKEEFIDEREKNA
jgi:hypothetical protein